MLLHWHTGGTLMLLMRIVWEGFGVVYTYVMYKKVCRSVDGDGNCYRPLSSPSPPVTVIRLTPGPFSCHCQYHSLGQNHVQCPQGRRGLATASPRGSRRHLQHPSDLSPRYRDRQAFHCEMVGGAARILGKIYMSQLLHIMSPR